MKQLNPIGSSEDLEPIVSAYPSESDEFFAEGHYANQEQQSNEKAMLKLALSTISKRWFSILLFTLLITVASIFYVAQKPDYFTSKARIQVNAENSVLPSGSGASGPIIISSAANDPAYFTTQLQVLEGSSLLLRVVKSLDLENNANFNDPNAGRKRTAWQNVQRMAGLAEPPEQAAAADSKISTQQPLSIITNDSRDDDVETDRLGPYVKKIQQSLVITPVKDNRTANRETRLIQIEYTHGDRELAAKITNAIADIYVLQNLEQKIQGHASAGDFFQKRVAELQSAIRLGEERLVNYSRDNLIVSPDANQNTVVQRLGDLNLQLGQAENDRIAAQTAYQASLQNQMRPAIAEGGDPQVTTLQAQLRTLEQKLAQLKSEYTDEWWEVVQTRKQIADVQKQLVPLQTRASDIQIARLKEKLDETANREQKLRDAFTAQREQVIKQNEASINYRIIQQEVDTNKSLLASLLQRSRENDIILNDTPNNVLVSERAAVPAYPAGPERSKTILIAFLASLISSFGIAFLLGWIDDSVQYSESIEDYLGLPLLAAIPQTTGLGESRFSAKKLLPDRLKSRRDDRYDIAVFEQTDIAEAYHQMRTRLMLSRAGGAPKTILITSGQEREGKTITALNLAFGLAGTGKKVLLIDADLRCPRVNIIRNLNNDTGLTTLLTSGNITDELLRNTIKQDAEGLHVLTAGAHSINPTNLLSSDEMKDLIKRLSRDFTHIVIDSPPALYFADSTILSTLADSLVIVVRHGVSSAQSLRKMQRIFQSVGARITGMVFNCVPRKSNLYSKYQYYGTQNQIADNGSIESLKLG
jgi:succinoglycan biosynthesis transport protein ExoP